MATREEWIDLLDPDEATLREALPGDVHERALAHLLEPARHDDEPRPGSRRTRATSSASSSFRSASGRRIGFLPGGRPRRYPGAARHGAANDQNEVMKRLTVIAAILLLPTFIVGLYGQNFRHIPELAWGLGYWWSWGWIILTTIIQLAFFRWLGWIGGDPLGRPHIPPLKTLDPRRLRGRRRRQAAAVR